MRLGVAYNFFNGEEHLLASLQSVRQSTTFICIVAQKFSNSGEEITADALDVLEAARNSGLVDQIIWFSPNPQLKRQKNELKKRVLGLKACRMAGCDYFLSMDADEFYRHHELEAAKEIILEEKLTQTTVLSYFHLRRPVYRSLDTTRVPFISKIGRFTKLGVRRYPSEMVDPTRTVFAFPPRHRLFSQETVAMYHMNFVRKDFNNKLRNSSTVDRSFLDSVYLAIDEWRFPNSFHFSGKGVFDLEFVANEFNTFDPGYPSSAATEQV